MFKYIQLIITTVLSISISSLHKTVELNFFDSTTLFSPIFLTIPLFTFSVLFFFFSEYLNSYLKFLILTIKSFILGSLPSLFYKIAYLKANNLDYFDLSSIRLTYLYSYEERLLYLTNLLNINNINYLNYSHFTDVVSNYALKYNKLQELREIANNIILEVSSKNLEIPSKSYWQSFQDIICQPLFYIPFIFIASGTLFISFRYYNQKPIDKKPDDLHKTDNSGKQEVDSQYLELQKAINELKAEKKSEVTDAERFMQLIEIKSKINNLESERTTTLEQLEAVKKVTITQQQKLLNLENDTEVIQNALEQQARDMEDALEQQAFDISAHKILLDANTDQICRIMDSFSNS